MVPEWSRAGLGSQRHPRNETPADQITIKDRKRNWIRKDTHVYKGNSIERVFLLGTAVCVMVMGFIPTAVGAEGEAEMLKITVGEPTFLSNLRYQSSAAVAVSRTGTETFARIERHPITIPRTRSGDARGSACTHPQTPY